MAAYLVEEAHEAADAIRRDDGVDAELGDVLFVLASIAAIRHGPTADGLDVVAARSAEKMRERHPQLFGRPQDTRTWGEIKGEPQRRIDDLPASLPALRRAQQIGKRAARQGFDWPDAAGPRAKIDEELVELDEAAPPRHHDELGDVLFSVVNLARHLGVDAEAALADATDRFAQRFEAVRRGADAAGHRLDQLDASTLDALWIRAKQEQP